MNVSPRRSYDDAKPDGYLESDQDFVEHNMEAAVAFLEGVAEIAKHVTSRFTRLTGKIQLRKSVELSHHYEFLDTETKQTHCVDGMEAITQGFLSFAHDRITGKLKNLEIDNLLDVSGYDAYVFELLVQYIIFGKVLYA